MTRYDPGERVHVRVSVGKGAFASENLITIETADGPVSGFIRSNRVIEEGGVHYIEGTVVSQSATAVTVKLSGSFFTTTGLADIPPTEFRLAA